MPPPKGYKIDQPTSLPAGYKLDTPEQSKTLPGNPTETIGPLSTMDQLTAIKPITSQMSLPEKASTFLGNIGGGGLGVLLHPWDTAVGIGKSLLNPAATLKATYDAANTRPMETLSSGIGQTAVMAPLAEVTAGAVRKLPTKTRATITGDINKPITPGGITPAERYNSARALGVKLDAADATNSGVLKAVKKVNENSLLGSNTYDKARTANTGALNDSTGRILDSIYKGDRESGGRAIQNALTRDQQGLHTDATEGFQRLPQDYPIPGSVELGKAARAIRDSQVQYQGQFPSLVPRQANAVISDIAKLGPRDVPNGATPMYHGTTSDLVPQIRQSGLVPNSGNVLDDRITDPASKNYINSTFVAKDEPVAQQYAQLRSGITDQPGSVLKYQVPPEISSAMKPDEWDTRALRYEGSIPPEHLEAYRDAANGRWIPANSANFRTMQQLRSDLLELGRTNPDLVQNQSGGWLQQLAGGADAAMTDASTGLSPADQAVFRDANAKWADMKSTYDDPSNPLYHAVRTDNPSQLFGGVGPKTPEMVRNLERRLGNDIAPIRRGTVEGALKSTNDGSLNFKNFGSQFNRIPKDYRAELFTPAQQEMLGHVQNVSNLLGQDLNPSGSAKLGQKIGEAGMLGTAVVGHPTGLLPLAQYPVARLMNSPAVVDWMMQPRVAPRATPISLSKIAATPTGKKKR